MNNQEWNHWAILWVQVFLVFFFFFFLRNWGIVFQSGCTTLYFHQQCTRVLAVPHSHQHSLLSDCLTLVIVVSVKMIILICISLMTNNVEQFSGISFVGYLYGLSSDTSHNMIAHFQIESVIRVLYTHSRYKSFIRYMLCKHRLPDCGLSFYFLNVFGKTKSSSLRWSPIYQYHSILICVFHILLTKSLPN